MGAVIASTVVVPSLLEGNSSVRESLRSLLEGAAIGFAIMFGTWWAIRLLSRVEVHEHGLLAPSTFGLRADVRWDEIRSISPWSSHGFAGMRVQRDGRLSVFLPAEVFYSREFQRLVGTTSGARTPLCIPEKDLA